MTISPFEFPQISANFDINWSGNLVAKESLAILHLCSNVSVVAVIMRIQLKLKY